ncbi:ATP-binding cassette domain-containing protein, partial [[Eubacterium] siraeum]|nr:ATP-binding cassette domain-containing protein [[Eubacterium] siraeum]
DNPKAYADGILKRVNLYDDRNKKVGAQSGGMKQRLGIAQALVGEPKVVIFDEPTAGLDPKERIRFRHVISSLANDKIVILATHIVTDIAFIAKNVVLIDGG